MSTITEEKLEKLKKLVKHEESARQIGNEAEAQAFAMKIHELLTQYNIDIGQLKDSEQEKGHVVVTDIVIQRESLMLKNESDWLIWLWQVLAKYNYCKAVRVNSSGSFAYLTVIGKEVNLEIVKYLVDSLQPQIRNLSKKAFKSYQGFEKKNTFTRGFYKGAVKGLEEKLASQQVTELKDSENIRSLVIKNDSQVSEYYHQKFDGFRATRGNAKTGNSSYDGTSMGREAGRNLNTNSGIGTSNAGGNRLLN